MKKILTIIFDGFGIREDESGNAIKAADMKNFNDFFNSYPHALLHASEEYVGLMPGQMGNSEVGHMTIGAGRVIKSSISKIDDFLLNENIENANYNELISNPERRIHIMGLCSDGNVHSSYKHFLLLAEKLFKRGFKNVFFHLITDGRDTKMDVAMNYIEGIQELIRKYNAGYIATICGRYYAMDRDNNFDRTKAYYDLITKGKGLSALDLKKAIEQSYSKGITDEFIHPIVINPSGIIKDGDAIMWMNYRHDRAKQILKTFDKDFNEFENIKFNNLDIYSFFEVDKNINTKYFVNEIDDYVPLGIYLSKLGLHQARIAESEKFPHVTYFVDGGFDGKIENCDKFHIPSPNVPTYDLQPEMSAVGVTKKIVDCMDKDYDFILANFANPDMVGHTGNMQATTKACVALDLCLNKIIEKAEENFYTIILLADHGNADTMLNPDGSACTTHSLELVPFVINDNKISLKPTGSLANVAPTILDYMDIAIPSSMNESSLIK